MGKRGLIGVYRSVKLAIITNVGGKGVPMRGGGDVEGFAGGDIWWVSKK